MVKNDFFEKNLCFLAFYPLIILLPLILGHMEGVEALGVQGHLAADASEKASLPALLAHTLDCSLLWEVAPTVIPDSLQTDSA